ncbi:MAG: thiol:disulfide interchange protein DsbG [Burkholderiaceae bacterium]
MLKQRPYRSFIAILSLVLVTACSPDQNASADRPGVADRPAVVQALEAQGFSDVQEFDPGSGLRGFAGMAGDHPVAVYVTDDGNAIIGTRLSKEGEPLDEATLQELVARPMAQRTWAQLASATWVRDGQAEAPRIVYTFSDPNCPYCNRFWAAARPWVDSGKVQLRHLLVGVIRADSAAKAAAILEAADPSAALLENEHRFTQGGIEPVEAVSESAGETLEANQLLMASLGFRGTPGIVVLAADGMLKKYNGMPQGRQLDEVLGPR